MTDLWSGRCRTSENHKSSFKGPEKLVGRLLSARPHFEGVVVFCRSLFWPRTKEWMDYVFNADASVASNQKPKVSTKL